MQRIILHIDFDSFFASVAQQVNPLFRKRPIGVTATNGRTCIIAASREAKALGVKSPSRTYEAQGICPSIIFVPADFNLYWKISKTFIKICSDYTPYFEIFSLDEVFMDITRTAELFGGTQGIIDKIKSRLAEEVGEYITASFGISHNKLLAKLASGMNKPNGIVEIKPQDVQSVYKNTELTDICGIGSRIQARLNQMGIYSLPQLSVAPLNALIAEFGNVEGHFLYQVGRGEDDRKVIPHTEAPDVKSAGRNYCLPQNEYNTRKIYQNVYELCEEVSLKLRRLNKKARGVGFYLRGDINMGVNHTTGQYMNTGRELFETFLWLLDSENSEYSVRPMIRNSGDLTFRNTDIQSFPSILTYVRQISVWTYHLEDSSNIPSSIFPKQQREQKLTEIMDKINERFGTHTIRNGFLLYADKLTTVPNGFMADRYERKTFADTEETRLSNLKD